MGTKKAEIPFWERKRLQDMTTEEWESLCDGCGRCCLMKLEDEDTGRVYYTDVACRLLDCETCQCHDYPNRLVKVSDCLQLSPEKLEEIDWLPSTCAYRMLAEGQPLAWWHPLVSGKRSTVHEAGISVRYRTLSEDDVDEKDLEDRIVEWPEG